MQLENKILSDITGSPCPICGVERFYKTQKGADKGAGRPCRSCSNSIKSGGMGNVKNRGCFTCSDPDIYANSLCRECHYERTRNYHRDVYRWKKYGLDGPVEMKECEICSSPDDLVIDHCHGTGQFRGVLCRTCNLGLGSLKEDIELIKKAYEYAKRTFNAN
jgi:hypothetical protein